MTDPLTKDEVDADPKNRQTIELNINGNTFELEDAAAGKLEEALQHSYDIVKGQPDGMLTLARTGTSSDLTENPYHLQGEYGCRQSDKASSEPTNLNLSELAWKPVLETRDYTFTVDRTWVDGTGRSKESRDERMSISKYIANFICSRCQPVIEHWHTQRRIFLPKIATNTTLSDVGFDSFNHKDSEDGSCSACGTPQSAIAELPVEPPAMSILQKPITLCPTCRDLLIESVENPPFTELEYADHPLATEEQTPRRPYTDPDLKLTGDGKESPYPDNLLEAKVGNIGEMPRDDFIDFIKSLDGDAISKWTGRNLYNHDINSIKDLYQAKVKEIATTPMVSEQEAKEIKDGIEEELQRRYKKNDQNT